MIGAPYPFLQLGCSSEVMDFLVGSCIGRDATGVFGAPRPLWRLATKRLKESFQFLMAVVGLDIYATGNRRSRRILIRA